MRWAAVLVLASCSALPSHQSEPQGCRERTARALGTVYSQPADLAAVLDEVCGPLTVP